MGKKTGEHELDQFLTSKTQLFLEDLASIAEKDQLLTFLDIDLDPDTFLDYDEAEMVIVVAEIIRKFHGEPVLGLPEVLQKAMEGWHFSWTADDLNLVANALLKIVQNGSEMDLVMEGRGQETLAQFHAFVARRIAWFRQPVKPSPLES